MNGARDLVLAEPWRMKGEPREEPPGEVSLVDAARSGDSHAFRRLHDRYARMVHGLLLASAPRAEVEDLMQDVFLQAYRSLGSLRDSSAFGAWLARIARNRAHDYHRTSTPTEELREDVAAPLSREAEALAALRAVRSLPPSYRETLTLRLVEGMTGPEIAERTGLTPDSVRVNLHRGMKLLREALLGEGRS